MSKVHKEGQNHHTRNREVILIGHEGHPEVEGTMGRIPGGVHLISRPEDVSRLEIKDPDKVAYVTQTTLSVDETRDVITALKDRFLILSAPMSKTFAMRHKTGKPPSASWPTKWICFWLSVQRTARIQIASAKSAKKWESLVTSSMMPTV